MGAGAGLPSLLYNHVRSFLVLGVFDLAGLSGLGRFFLLSFAGPPRLLELLAHCGLFIWRCFPHRL